MDQSKMTFLLSLATKPESTKRYIFQKSIVISYCRYDNGFFKHVAGANAMEGRNLPVPSLLGVVNSLI